jgi:hypothetical protein
MSLLTVSKKKVAIPLAILILVLSLSFTFPSKSTYAASCVGKQTVHLSSTHITAYLNSCTTKEIINARDESAGWVSGIGGVISIIKGTGQFGPYAAATGGILWMEIGLIKRISDNGKYGISFTTTLRPSIIIPWRND